jgi:hypothetical protein
MVRRGVVLAAGVRKEVEAMSNTMGGGLDDDGGKTK